jgi:cyclic beta-1,2-glucan synthetase
MPLQRELNLAAARAAPGRPGRPSARAVHPAPAAVDEPRRPNWPRCAPGARALQADGRPLLHQVRAWSDRARDAGQPWPAWPPLAVPVRPCRPTPKPHRPLCPDGRNFVRGRQRHQRPPRPWINVLANPGFGAWCPKRRGNTWAGNSRLNQLTAWANDPVADPPGEWFLLQDRRSARSGAGAIGLGPRRRCYQVTHAQGLTTHRHRRRTLAGDAAAGAWTPTGGQAGAHAAGEPGSAQAHLRLAGLVEWVLGEKRSDRATLHTRPCLATPAVRLRPACCCAPSRRHRRLAAAPPSSASCGADGRCGPCGRSTWTGPATAAPSSTPRGQLVLPERLLQRAGAAWTPVRGALRLARCARRQRRTGVPARLRRPTVAAARRCCAGGALVPAGASEQPWTTGRRWDALRCAGGTPDPLFDAMVNRWLLYQTVSCRLWAKAGFYQAGGATGFRDQLQDAMALALGAPRHCCARRSCCARRASSPRATCSTGGTPGGAGVRTHFSDDLLWLPLRLLHYLRAPATPRCWTRPCPSSTASPCPPGAEDAYDTPSPSVQRPACTSTRARHRPQPAPRRARPAADGWRRLERRHEPRRPRGRGESVWLAWFLCAIVIRDWCRWPARGERTPARRSAGRRRAGWRAALGSRPGTAPGTGAPSSTTAAAGLGRGGRGRIDLIAQAWAVLGRRRTPRAPAHGHGRGGPPAGGRTLGLMRLLTRRWPTRSPAPATSRPTRRVCARTAASTPTPPCGR